MKDEPATRQEYTRFFNTPMVGARWLVLIAAMLFSICALLAIFNAVGAATISYYFRPRVFVDSLKSSPSSPPLDYSKFSHTSPSEHAALMGRNNCVSCHRANGALEPSFPRHMDCIECHLVEFTAPNSSSATKPICTICHNEKELNSPKAPLKEFPRLLSFAAEFDHAQHLRGIETARPAEGCAACHTKAANGTAETIPARINAHQTCYQCHSSGKQASNLSGCGVCHQLGRYSPTSITSRSYRVGFSHSDHGPGQRLTCESCHNVRGRGMPQSNQVSSTSPLLHHSNPRSRSCMTCHNGRRAFGDAKAEFVNCKRCHKGQTFRS